MHRKISAGFCTNVSDETFVFIFILRKEQAREKQSLMWR